MGTPFQFGLERVRQVRAHAEDQAKEQFAASLAHRLRGEAMLLAAEDLLSSARARAVPDAGIAVPGVDLLARQAYVERLERSRVQAANRLTGLDHQLAASRAALTQASRGREVLDRLREREREAHRVASERRESAALDEMAIQLHNRRAAA
jgi:flagellar FliJ protein